MEYVEGCELFRFVSERERLAEIQAVFLFRQIIEGLIYASRLQIAHRDLKPENILIDREAQQIKLIDFGMAAFQPNGDKLSTACGSPHYAAPELLSCKAYDSVKVDVWSSAVVLFVLLCGYPPFNWSRTTKEADRGPELYGRILHQELNIPGFLSPEARDLLTRALERDPQKRLSLIEVWAHPFMHKFDTRFGYEGKSVHEFIGPNPTIDVHDWAPPTHETIDINIFRNVQLLWHDYSEEYLLEKITNDEYEYLYIVLVLVR